VASGSRDKTVKLWCVPTDSDASTSYRQLETPLHTFHDHGDKVRDLRYCRDIKRLAGGSLRTSIRTTLNLLLLRVSV
jgi:WD40 repeat protein